MPTITPFQRTLIAAEVATTTPDPGWDTLVSAAVPVGHVGAIKATLTATVQCQYTVPGSTFLGVAFRALWDGAPLPEVSYAEFDPATPPPNVDTIAFPVSFVAIVPAAAPGAHTLAIQWQVLAAGEEARIFPDCGQLTVEGVS